MSNHHATLSPSGFPKFNQCPKYQSTGGTSEAAEEGTRQHEDLEILLTWCGKEDGNYFDGVLWAHDKIREQFKTYKSEVELKLLGGDFRVITFGTADVVGRLHSGMLAVGDYKSGMQSEYWEQLAVYALMAMQKHGETECMAFIWYGKDEWEEYRHFTDVEAWEIVGGIIDKVNDPEAKPALCDYCKWCKHESTCEQPTKAITTVATGYTDPIDIDGIDTWHASEITDPNQMAKVYQIAQYLEKWAKNAKHGVKEAIRNGMEVPGYKLRAGNKLRKISNIPEAFALSGLSQEEFLSCCSVSVSDMEKLIAEKEGLKGKAVKELVNARLEEVIYIKQNDDTITKQKGKK